LTTCYNYYNNKTAIFQSHVKTPISSSVQPSLSTNGNNFYNTCVKQKTKHTFNGLFSRTTWIS